ncbi:MAG: lipid-A-disaccharide synthase [Bacteroidales bacterium]|nr:lipid-A-disaccharide synthase [Bacteroidales bacterium]
MKYYIIAGEASGDMHASNLMKGLLAEDPDAVIRYWGGEKMDEVYRSARGSSGLVYDYRETAVMGYVQILSKLGTILQRARFCEDDILEFNPDVVILVDYPGFNLRIARYAHNNGYRVFYYIAPKVWAHKEYRNKQLKRYVDRLYVVFPFETEYFASKGIKYVYKGNPLLDAVDTSPQLTESREEFFAGCGIPDCPYIALLAGSRNQEIASMMPLYMRLADVLHRDRPGMRFLIAAGPKRSDKDYEKYIGRRDYVHIIHGRTYGVLRHAEAAVINSGTASLEAALIGTPQVVCYRAGLLIGLIVRIFIKIKYVSLGNLILDKLAFREILQSEFTLANVRREVERLLDDKAYVAKMKEDYAEIRSRLGGKGASRAVARSMIAELVALKDRKV